MGYYSQIALGMGDFWYEKYQEAVSAIPKIVQMTPDQVIHDTVEGMPAHIIVWDWHKWYSSSEFVKKVEELVDEGADDESKDPSHALKFIRIGEESGDYEIAENDCSYDVFFDLCRTEKIVLPSTKKSCIAEAEESLAKLIRLLTNADLTDEETLLLGELTKCQRMLEEAKN